MRAMQDHLHGCASCASDVLGRVQLKHVVKSAGMRYSPSPALRERVQKGLPAQKTSARIWGWPQRLAASFAFLLIGFFLFRGWFDSRQRRTIAELADLHVTTLSSSAPVDVISTDRHTVKPWFQGKIPFTFNIPELGGTPFSLLGGRMSYLDQAPGAQLIFNLGNHHISVFIFQKRQDRAFASGEGRSKTLTFNVEAWAEDDLQYFVIGDADPSDIHKLSDLLKAAARP